jgi:hypothetical protein
MEDRKEENESNTSAMVLWDFGKRIVCFYISL